MSWFKKFINNQNWLLIMPPAIILTWLSWPVGKWHLWSWLWIGITILVLILEMLGAWLSPEKKTISDQMRDYHRDHPVNFWLIMTAFLGFAWTLHIHLTTYMPK